MSRSSHHYGHASGMAGDIGGVAVIGLVLLLALAVFLLIKAINLVCRVMAAHSSNKLLWVLLGCVIFFSVIALATRGEPIAVLLMIVSILGLLLVCRILDLYYANTLQKQGKLIENVLKPHKWWE